jgi:hypothetical protein
MTLDETRGYLNEGKVMIRIKIVRLLTCMLPKEWKDHNFHPGLEVSIIRSTGEKSKVLSMCTLASCLYLACSVKAAFGERGRASWLCAPTFPASHGGMSHRMKLAFYCYKD